MQAFSLTPKCLCIGIMFQYKYTLFRVRSAFIFILAVIFFCTSIADESPRDLRLTRVDTGQLTFTWTPVNSNCPSINYMATLNCGDCSVAIGTTTTICSGLQLPNVCSFTVTTMACGQVRAPSDPISVNLRGINCASHKVY